MHETSVIHVNLSAIADNLRVIRSIVGTECKLCPIVKADAYGLGAARISKTLLAAGADMLAVYTANQAAELIHSAIGAPILVLMPLREIDRVDDLYRGLICGKLHLTVHDGDHLRDLIVIAERFGAGIPVHLEVDTGMSRGGCSLDEAPGLLRKIAEHSRLQLAGLFTHFASAEADESFTDEQMRTFNALVAENKQHIPPQCAIHAANTFATLRAQRYHKSMVRVGLAWAGYGMEALRGGEIIAQGQQLLPAITWTSSIIQIRRIAAGARVGYGSTWTAKRPSVIGLIPVGYADGYPVQAGRTDRNAAGAMVAIEQQGRRRYVSVVGAVNMDQIAVDLTDHVDPSEPNPVTVGTPVELITADPSAPNHLPKLAESAGTIAHEMICRLNSRLKRTYRMAAQPEPSRTAPKAAAV